jgi:hypothetical protein
MSIKESIFFCNKLSFENISLTRENWINRYKIWSFHGDWTQWSLIRWSVMTVWSEFPTFERLFLPPSSGTDVKGEPTDRCTHTHTPVVRIYTTSSCVTRHHQLLMMKPGVSKLWKLTSHCHGWSPKKSSLDRSNLLQMNLTQHFSLAFLYMMACRKSSYLHLLVI